jgi:tRNA-modifying protein YgfZ
VSALRYVDLGLPALLEFRGPDAVRFLNGQLTQDVRLVAHGEISLPSCVTDAKGKLQFRVIITGHADGTLWIECPADSASGLEARLTRYLIADDAEVADLTGNMHLLHLIGTAPETPPGVIARASHRFGTAGTDWWIPISNQYALPDAAVVLAGDELEALRIANGVPAWGRELTEGMLPPEAGLDATDVSYQKGCYIGQEVISRIKSAGKVNRRLVRFALDADVMSPHLIDHAGNPAGELTSISPLSENGVRPALGYVKRGVESVFAVGMPNALRMLS